MKIEKIKKMPIPSLKKQILGDFEKQLNKIRNKMNQDIADKCLEIIEKRKENRNKKRVRISIFLG